MGNESAYDLIIEEASFGANPGTKDLARHLYTRIFCGKVLIVADNSAAVLGPLRKQWLKLARKAQKEAASTLNTVRLYEFSIIIPRMYTAAFTAKPLAEIGADIDIACYSQLPLLTSEYRTIYICKKLRLEQLDSIASQAPKKCVLVVCPLS